MFYGAAVWDPILIISQILSLQCLFYLSLGLWSTVLLVPTQGPLTVIFVFGWQHLHWSGWPGWLAIGANLLNAVVTAFFFAWIVERAKKCVDFAITLYVFHFILCWCYAGFPAGVSWWATNGTCVLVLCFLSEALCLRREMADIPVTSTSRGRGGSGTPATPGGGGGASGSGGSSSGPASANKAPAARGAVVSGGVQMSEVVGGVKITTRLLSGSDSGNGNGSSMV